jgi:hypothetical protein
MTDSNDKVLDRVRKLLELAKSANMNEAGNAAAAAQTLMSRHSITEAMIDVSRDQDEKDEPIASDALHIHGETLPTWKSVLADRMCGVNQCKSFRIGGSLYIVGRPSDAGTVRYLFAFVAREIDRLCIEAASALGSPGKTWLNNFRLGAATEVARRLEEAHQATRAAMRQEAHAGDTLGNGVALMRVNNALTKLNDQCVAVEKYSKEVLKIRAGRRIRSRYDPYAHEAGKRAGASIDLSGGSNRGALGAGARAAIRG